MAGLPSRNGNILQQWYHLFSSRIDDRSLFAQQNWKQLIKLGLPDRRHENWKYTPIDELFKHNFVMQKVTTALTTELVSDLALTLDAVRLVFVNGQFNPSLSDTDFDFFEIRIAEAAEYRNLPKPIQPEIFLHLTESLAEQAITIRLAHNQKAKRPLYLLHISSGCREKVLNTVHYRHHLQLETNAKAQIIEHYISLNELPHFTGARLTMVAGDNTQLIHTKLLFENADSYHFAHNDIVVGCDANISSHSFLLGANLSRHNTSIQLDGKNSNLSLNSLALPINQEICDIRTFLVNQKGYCYSRQLHKAVVRDHARVVFDGLIKVAQHALKTDSKMINNNLLLGPLAEVDSRPQLEIYADDVKCRHGTTIGRVDEEQIFYLRMRGISEEIARCMIIYAFFTELTETIDDEILKLAILQRIKQRTSLVVSVQ